MDANLEKQKLLDKRNSLVLSKREHEAALVAVKNLVRASGLMPKEKYKQCCNSQNTHNRAIVEIESQLSEIKIRLREIHYSEAETIVIPVVTDLVALRTEYQNFAADPTRVSSMRQMAAEFVIKLNPIIKRAVGPSTVRRGI